MGEETEKAFEQVWVLYRSIDGCKEALRCYETKQRASFDLRLLSRAAPTETYEIDTLDWIDA